MENVEKCALAKLRGMYDWSCETHMVLTLRRMFGKTHKKNTALCQSSGV